MLTLLAYYTYLTYFRFKTGFSYQAGALKREKKTASGIEIEDRGSGRIENRDRGSGGIWLDLDLDLDLGGDRCSLLVACSSLPPILVCTKLGRGRRVFLPGNFLTEGS